MTAREAFWRGRLDAAPFILSVVPYSMLFGVVARDSRPDPIRIVAALAALHAGLCFGVIWAILAGMGTLYLLQFVTNQT